MVHTDLEEAAERAYVFTYPLVMHYRTMYRQALGGGAPGRWLHLPPATPEHADIVTPCHDCAYSYAWLDLRDEPWVLTVPPIEGGRYFTSQWNDLWGHVVANVGSLTDGNDATTALIVGPGWDDRPPPGVDRIVRGETSLMGTLTRVQHFGGADLAAVRAIQDSLDLRPLSTWTGPTGRTAGPDATGVDDRTAWPHWHEGSEETPAFWDYARFLLRFATPHPQDREAWRDLHLLGLTGEPPAPDEALQEALAAAPRRALASMQEAGAAQVTAAALFGDRTAMRTRYLDRALGVLLGILGNVEDQACYRSLLLDTDGEPIDGRHAYTLTFPAGETPPVEFFWSVTAYSLPDRLLVPNDAERYAIGNRTAGLRAEDDGSLVLHLSSAPPRPAHRANWLPLADGPTWIVLRAYGPDRAILDGHWHAPVPQRVS